MGNQISTLIGRRKKKRKQSLHSKKIAEQKDSNSSDESEEILELEHFYNIEIEGTEESRITLGMDSCRKEKKHNEYIPFENLTLNDLPEPIQHQAVLDYIFARGKLVVKIELSQRSPHRESEDGKQLLLGHCASGYACLCEDQTIEANCPKKENCPVSSESHTVFGGILVTTNRHVIQDEFETNHSQFHFFYESDTTNNDSAIGYGYALRDDSSNKDYVGIKVFLHDDSVVDKIKQYASDAGMAWHHIPPDIQTEFEKLTVVISHPHGWLKQVSFGKLLEKEKMDEKSGKRVSEYTSLTCNGSSGSPVLTGFYWNNPFVHSSGVKKRDGKFVGKSFFY